MGRLLTSCDEDDFAGEIRDIMLGIEGLGTHGERMIKLLMGLWRFFWLANEDNEVSERCNDIVIQAELRAL